MRSRRLRKRLRAIARTSSPRWTSGRPCRERRRPAPSPECLRSADRSKCKDLADLGHSSAAPVHVGAQDLESLVKAHASNGLPAGRTQRRRSMTTEIATFGAGCFWVVEAAFSRGPGVVEAVSGYIGGRT